MRCLLFAVCCSPPSYCKARCATKLVAFDTNLPCTTARDMRQHDGLWRFKVPALRREKKILQITDRPEDSFSSHFARGVVVLVLPLYRSLRLCPTHIVRLFDARCRPPFSAPHHPRSLVPRSLASRRQPAGATITLASVVSSKPNDTTHHADRGQQFFIYHVHDAYHRDLHPVGAVLQRTAGLLRMDKSVRRGRRAMVFL